MPCPFWDPFLIFIENNPHAGSSDFPNKNQTIVLIAVENLVLRDYVAAVANVVTTKNVSFEPYMGIVSIRRTCINFKSLGQY